MIFGKPALFLLIAVFPIATETLYGAAWLGRL
jgi:hypothetical protein